MKEKKFSLAKKDEEMRELIRRTDKRILARFAIDCTERVISYFESNYPNDPRPRAALDTLQTWLNTGVFHMAVIRKASLDAHQAAKDVGEDTPARSAAHAAGQAVATAHVADHAYGPAIYAQQAIFRASTPEDADNAVAKERDWQYNHLLELRKEY